MSTTPADLLAADGSLKDILPSPNDAPRPSVPAPPRGPGRPRGSTKKAGAKKQAAKRAVANPRTSATANGVAEAALAARADRKAETAPATGRPTVMATQQEIMMTQLLMLHAGIGMLAKMLGHLLGEKRGGDRIKLTADVFMQQAPVGSEALISWAETSKTVADALDKVQVLGGAMLVASAYLPVAFAAMSGEQPALGESGEAQMIASVAQMAGVDLGAMFAQVEADAPAAA